MPDGIEPLIGHREQLILRLRELRHLQVDERQLVVEYLFRPGVQQLDFMMEIGRIVVVEREVQDADGINRLQLVVPVAAPGLFADGECGIEHATDVA